MLVCVFLTHFSLVAVAWSGQRIKETCGWDHRKSGKFTDFVSSQLIMTN
jgi:hypothetical protein